MIELKLKVFNVLFGVLSEDLADNRAYDCIKIMCASTIKALNEQNNDPVTYSRYQLKLILDGESAVAKMDSKALGKWMSEKKLNNYLELVKKSIAINLMNLALLQS